MQAFHANTTPSPSLAEAATELAKTFTGKLLQPSDPDYEEVRKVHNGLVDKRPALIARCRGVADIRDAVGLARTLNLEVAVRGGGHNVAGRATVDRGLMIDLSPDEGHSRRSEGANRPRARRPDLGRVQPRNPALRAGHHGRGGVDDRNCRPDAWRRHRLADGQTWPRARQSDSRWIWSWRMAAFCRRARTRTPTCSGAGSAEGAISGSPHLSSIVSTTCRR